MNSCVVFSSSRQKYNTGTFVLPQPSSAFVCSKPRSVVLAMLLLSFPYPSVFWSPLVSCSQYPCSMPHIAIAYLLLQFILEWLCTVCLEKGLVSLYITIGVTTSQVEIHIDTHIQTPHTHVFYGTIWYPNILKHPQPGKISPQSFLNFWPFTAYYMCMYAFYVILSKQIYTKKGLKLGI